IRHHNHEKRRTRNPLSQRLRDPLVAMQLFVPPDLAQAAQVVLFSEGEVDALLQFLSEPACPVPEQVPFAGLNLAVPIADEDVVVVLTGKIRHFRVPRDARACGHVWPDQLDYLKSNDCGMCPIAASSPTGRKWPEQMTAVGALLP